MKVFLGHVDWGLATEGLQSNSAHKTFLGLCIVSNVCDWPNLMLKLG